MSIYGEARTRDLYFPTIDAISTRVTALEAGGGGGAPFDPTAIEADITALQATDLLLTGDIADLVAKDMSTDLVLADHETRIVDLEGGGGGGGSGIALDYLQENTLYDKSAITIKPWREDLLMYYDFADKDDIGRDVTGNQRHLTQTHKIDTVSYASDATRTHTIEFKRRLRPAVAPNLYSNIAHLDMSSYLPAMNLSAFTISFWVYKTVDSAGPALLSFCNDTASIITHAVILRESTNRLRFVCYVANVKMCDIIFTDAMFEDNKWMHICFATDATGNSLYGNGVKATQYVTAGSPTTHINLSAGGLFQPNTFMFGANPVYTAYNTERSLRWDFSGKMSDISIWNRRLSDAEVTALYNDQYGYMCFILAGQSNMMGVGSTTTDPFDSDYSLHKGKVFQFNSEDNVDAVGALLGTTISPATVNLKHFGMSAFPNSVGLWKTFTDDLMRYGNVPFRKRVLLIPVAQGSTGFTNYWSPGLPNYIKCVTASNAVLDGAYNALNKMNTLHGFLWNQGEESIRVDFDLNYQANFIAMMAGFQANIPRFVNIPAVFAETAGNYYDEFVHVGTNTHMKTFVNNAYSLLALGNPKWELVKTIGAVEFIADTKHMDIASYRKLGYWYFDSYCKASGIPNRKPQNNASIVLNPKYGENVVQLYKPLKLMPPAYGYTDLALTGYYRYAFSPAGSGAGVVAVYPLVLTRFGNIVIIQSNTSVAFTVASNAFPLTLTAMPVDFRPTAKLNFSIFGINASSNDTYVLSVLSDGVITIADSSGGGGFGPGVAISVQAFSITYVV